MSSELDKKVSLELDAETIYKFESLLREGLVAASAVSEADNENFTLNNSSVEVELDLDTAMKFSEFLREGLVAASAVSDADNDNFTLQSSDDKSKL